jgi:hypothetical protein
MRPEPPVIGRDVLADMGYCHGNEIKACEEAGMTVYIQKVNTSANTALGLFGKERFVYEPQEDCYRCPAEEKLTYHLTARNWAERFVTTGPWPVTPVRSKLSAHAIRDFAGSPAG